MAALGACSSLRTTGYSSPIEELNCQGSVCRASRTPYGRRVPVLAEVIGTTPHIHWERCKHLTETRANHIIPCRTFPNHKILCETLANHRILCETFSNHKILRETLANHRILCKALQIIEYYAKKSQIIKYCVKRSHTIEYCVKRFQITKYCVKRLHTIKYSTKRLQIIEYCVKRSQTIEYCVKRLQIIQILYENILKSNLHEVSGPVIKFRSEPDGVITSLAKRGGGLLFINRIGG